jgi:hypothetical protein
MAFKQCYPGFGMGKKIRIRIRDEQQGSYFRVLRNHLYGVKKLKYINSFMRIRDPGWKKFGSGMEKIRIRDGKSQELICFALQVHNF